jgi:hypothetical protein
MNLPTANKLSPGFVEPREASRGAPVLPAPYTQLAGAYRRFPNLLYRRFPNRRMVRRPGAPVGRTTCGLGNPRDSRLGSLRYKENAPSVPLRLKPIAVCKVQDPPPLWLARTKFSR